jgi:hypothetical protein
VFCWFITCLDITHHLVRRVVSDARGDVLIFVITLLKVGGRALPPHPAHGVVRWPLAKGARSARPVTARLVVDFPVALCVALRVSPPLSLPPSLHVLSPSITPALFSLPLSLPLSSLATHLVVVADATGDDKFGRVHVVVCDLDGQRVDARGRRPLVGGVAALWQETLRSEPWDSVAQGHCALTFLRMCAWRLCDVRLLNPKGAHQRGAVRGAGVRIQHRLHSFVVRVRAARTRSSSGCVQARDRAATGSGREQGTERAGVQGPPAVPAPRTR